MILRGWRQSPSTICHARDVSDHGAASAGYHAPAAGLRPEYDRKDVILDVDIQSAIKTIPFFLKD